MTKHTSLERINRDFQRAGIRARLLEEDDVQRLPKMRGAYALIVNLAQEVHVDRPRNAQRALPSGWYVYAGSARGPGGIRARLARHFRKEKRIHWHIDQLTCASCAQVWACSIPEGHECDLVEKMIRSELFHTANPGFGSSDCKKCKAHLLAWRPG